MKILYGVVGEGMGHAMRSRVIVDHLLAQGHQVEIMASSRAVDYLRKWFSEVHRIQGLHIVTEANRVRRGKTLWSNVRDGLAAIPDQIASYFKLVEDFDPDVVISDFESWSYFYAKAHRIPVLSLDNQQLINRCTHPPEILQGERTNFEVTRAFIKSKLPFCDHYLVTTFYRPPIRKERTTLVPPILRPEILRARTSPGDHLLVYQTAEGNEQLIDALGRTGMECRIYGMRRQIQTEQIESNLRYRPFSEQGFIEDLASARAVIASAGFTLMSECVYLHKPLLAIPVAGQFEQVINARYLQRAGYGRTATRARAEDITTFVGDIPRCEASLAGYEQDGNRDVLATLDEHLDRAAAGLY